jgi:K+/H+ antiporter YhaU regulatory subunit KhtT
MCAHKSNREFSMDDETAQLLGLVHQLANGVLVQARKLEELQKRIEQLEYQRQTNAVGRTYGDLNIQA